MQGGQSSVQVPDGVCEAQGHRAHDLVPDGGLAVPREPDRDALPGQHPLDIRGGAAAQQLAEPHVVIRSGLRAAAGVHQPHHEHEQCPHPQHRERGDEQSGQESLIGEVVLQDERPDHRVGDEDSPADEHALAQAANGPLLWARTERADSDEEKKELSGCQEDVGGAL